jgi:hypothetical protein
MLKNTVRLFSLVALNIFVIFNSSDIDVEQFLNDIYLFLPYDELNILNVYLLISTSVSLLTLILIYIFKPFTEIYLLYIFKFNFYFLINLVSISTTYIVLRVYGYSRFFLLIYLVMSSVTLYVTDKIKR